MSEPEMAAARVSRLQLRMELLRFCRESNLIEGIASTSIEDIVAHEAFLELPEVRVADLENFARKVQPDARLRIREGMDVVIGGASKQPPPGGRLVEAELLSILGTMTPTALASGWSPYDVHRHFEHLHPFTDGNGRTGRVLWAWHMRKLGKDPFARPFLHEWYYQSLDR